MELNRDERERCLKYAIHFDIEAKYGLLLEKQKTRSQQNKNKNRKDQKDYIDLSYTISGYWTFHLEGSCTNYPIWPY